MSQKDENNIRRLLLTKVLENLSERSVTLENKLDKVCDKHSLECRIHENLLMTVYIQDLILKNLNKKD